MRGHHPKRETKALHEHHHSHHLHDTRGVAKSRLGWSLFLIIATMIAELIGGWWSNSLALISEGAHMFTHAFALGLSLIAIVLGERLTSRHKTFGFYRFEVLAAFINAAVLFLMTALIVYESIHRISHPDFVSTREMFVLGAVGFCVNSISGVLLKNVGKDDVNVHSAFIHMLSDLIGSIGIIMAAIVIHATGWLQADPIVSLLISILIIMWSWGLLQRSTHVLLQGVPLHISLDQVITTIQEHFPEVKDVHDLHIWEMTTKMYILTAHVAVSDMPLAQASDLAKRLDHHFDEIFDISHSTIQLEIYQSADACDRSG